MRGGDVGQRKRSEEVLAGGEPLVENVEEPAKLAVVVIGGGLASLVGRVRDRRVESVIQELHHVGVKLGRPPDAPAKGVRPRRPGRRPEGRLPAVGLAEMKQDGQRLEVGLAVVHEGGHLARRAQRQVRGRPVFVLLPIEQHELVGHAQLFEGPVYPGPRASRPGIEPQAHRRRRPFIQHRCAGWRNGIDRINRPIIAGARPGPRFAVQRCVRFTFDRGTLLLTDLADLPAGLEVAQIPGVLWDARVGVHRAPARLCYPLVSELRRRGVPVADMPRPALPPPSGFRPFDLRPYQEAALTAWRQAGRRGIAVLPTGSGKTRLALGAIAATQTPALCLAPTRALCDQWAAALVAVWDGPIGRFGDGERMIGAVTIATYAAAYRHMSSLGDKFGLLIVDEAHHFGQGWRDEALEMSIAPLRLGLTATPPAPGPAADRLTSLVGPVVFERSIADLAGRYLAPLERVTWHVALDPDERREHDALWDVYRQARRAFEGNHLGGSWEDFLHEAARTDEGRRGLAAWRRAKRILAFPRRKREALALLLGHHRAQRTLVFVADNQTAYTVAREHLIMPLTCDI